MEESKIESDLSRKERREKKRQIKELEFENDRRLHLIKKIIPWSMGVLGVLIVIGIAWWFLQRQVPKTTPGEFIPELSRDHIPVGSSHVAYNSNPPTSGPHYADPQPCGIYDEEIPDEAVIHTLEHGAVWISFRPDISAELKDALTSLAQRYSKVVLSPRKANESDVAAAAWTRLLKVSASTFNPELLEDFIKAWRNHAPENVPC